MLNWEEYPQFEEIQTNDNISTMIISYKSEIADKILKDLEKWAKTNDIDTLSSYKDDIEIVKFFNKFEDVAYVEPFFNWILIRFLNQKLKIPIIEFLKNNDKNEIRTVVDISHTAKTYDLNEGLLIKTRTGIHEKNDVITPYTFYQLRKGETLIGNALLEYFNGEMGQFEPTIVLIEIQDDYKRIGYGKKFLDFIEKNMSALGFIRIWSSNTQNIPFWEKMGYEIDIDEGFKILNNKQ